MTLENLFAWSLQLLVLAAAGTLLPVVFRLRDPRWQPRYYQAVLALCLLLPVLQPWPSEIILVRSTQIELAARTAAIPAPRVPIEPAWAADQIAFAVLAAGALARAAWLAIGLLRLRRHRRDARPLYPLPPAVDAARERAGADAVVCLAADQTGPVTFGLRVPLILLPPSFLELPRDAQFAVACHEFLHVRRRDWAQHIAEEVVSILFWFHPAVWWLVSRIRLTREQAVDREVVLLTQARDPYVEALLTMSGARPVLDLAPAPLFLRRGHLVERISSIVKEVSMSKRRLIGSYLSMGAALAGATWMGAALFPLRGPAQVQTTPSEQQRRAEAERLVKERLEAAAAALRGSVSQDTPGVTVTPGGPILHRTGVSYPIPALRQRISGQVVLDLSLDAAGNVVDARAISGPEQLRNAALGSVLNWHYEGTAPKRIQATIDFNAENSPPPPPPPPPPPASGTLRKIDLSRLPEQLRSLLAPRLARFEGGPYSAERLQEIKEIVQEVEPHVTGFSQSGTELPGVFELTLYPPGAGMLPPAGSTVSAAFTSPPPEGVMRIRVGGNVQAAKLIHRVDPLYPPLARQARIQGTVRFNVLIDTEGRPKEIQLISGHPLMVQTALDAIKQWAWQPTLLNGSKAEVITQVDVNFTLNE
jgi:protein TonB